MNVLPDPWVHLTLDEADTVADCLLALVANGSALSALRIALAVDDASQRLVLLARVLPAALADPDVRRLIGDVSDRRVTAVGPVVLDKHRRAELLALVLRSTPPAEQVIAARIADEAISSLAGDEVRREFTRRLRELDVSPPMPPRWDANEPDSRREPSDAVRRSATAVVSAVGDSRRDPDGIDRALDAFATEVRGWFASGPDAAAPSAPLDPDTYEYQRALGELVAALVLRGLPDRADRLMKSLPEIVTPTGTERVVVDALVGTGHLHWAWRLASRDGASDQDLAASRIIGALTRDSDAGAFARWVRPLIEPSVLADAIGTRVRAALDRGDPAAARSGLVLLLQLCPWRHAIEPLVLVEPNLLGRLSDAAEAVANRCRAGTPPRPSGQGEVLPIGGGLALCASSKPGGVRLWMPGLPDACGVTRAHVVGGPRPGDWSSTSSTMPRSAIRCPRVSRSSWRRSRSSNGSETSSSCFRSCAVSPARPRGAYRWNGDVAELPDLPHRVVPTPETTWWCTPGRRRLRSGFEVEVAEDAEARDWCIALGRGLSLGIALGDRGLLDARLRYRSAADSPSVAVSVTYSGHDDRPLWMVPEVTWTQGKDPRCAFDAEIWPEELDQLATLFCLLPVATAATPRRVASSPSADCVWRGGLRHGEAIIVEVPNGDAGSTREPDGAFPAVATVAPGHFLGELDGALGDHRPTGVVGMHVSAVESTPTSVRVELKEHASGSHAMLECATRPAVHVGAVRVAPGDAEYDDALRGVVGARVSGFDVLPRGGMRLRSDQAAIVIRPAARDSSGEPLASLRFGGREQPWIWTVDDDCFEYLKPDKRREIRPFPDYGCGSPLWENSTPDWDVG
ncbi:hypothetical protein [Gordonia bronchialis]|uniref:hypothetical protein n=1 Tax=Gordonia bronchialis TaxID=2054 RepID=UPI00226DCEE5|nr:hypothetical protein [Gordonia bronchialis]